MTTAGFKDLNRKMKTVVVASLAFNLLVIGAVATAWHRHGGKHMRHGGVERSLMHFAHRKLPRDRRRALHKTWREERKSLRPLFKDVRSARKHVGRVLQVENFDRAALEQALESLRQKRSTVRQQASKAFVDLVATLSDEEKRAFGKFIEKDRRGWWRRRHKNRHD